MRNLRKFVVGVLNLRPINNTDCIKICNIAMNTATDGDESIDFSTHKEIVSLHEDRLAEYLRLRTLGKTPNAPWRITIFTMVYSFNGVSLSCFTRTHCIEIADNYTSAFVIPA